MLNGSAYILTIHINMMFMLSALFTLKHIFFFDTLQYSLAFTELLLVFFFLFISSVRDCCSIFRGEKKILILKVDVFIFSCTVFMVNVQENLPDFAFFFSSSAYAYIRIIFTLVFSSIFWFFLWIHNWKIMWRTFLFPLHCIHFGIFVFIRPIHFFLAYYQNKHVNSTLFGCRHLSLTRLCLCMCAIHPNSCSIESGYVL